MSERPKLTPDDIAYARAAFTVKDPPSTASERGRRFRLAHPGYLREWCRTHPEKEREYRHTRKLAHPNYFREWYESHPGKRAEYAANARRKRELAAQSEGASLAREEAT